MMAAEAQQTREVSQRDMGGVPRSESMPRDFAARLDAMQDNAERSQPRVHDLLAGTVKRVVIPRLVLAERGRASAPTEARLLAMPSVAEIEELVGLSMARGLPTILSFIDERRAGGLELESVYLDLLTPAVRRLGRMWDDDVADFGQVTIATERLRQVMRIYSIAQHGAPSEPHPTRRALLVPAPGNQHSFGLAMVAEFFGRAGWHFWSGVPDSTNQMVQMVRREWFGVIGFSAGTGVHLDALSEAIRRVRRMSRNRGIGVMVGGPVFLDHPELVALVGADATAADGRQAVLQANALLEIAAGRT